MDVRAERQVSRHTLCAAVSDPVRMFLSPIIYPVSFLPETLRRGLMLNPLTGIIEGYRASLLGLTPFNWTALAIAALITLLVLVYSAYEFRRMEKSFADTI